ncbi:hypothetical protein I6F35_27625 [Bradyrhizobium sp. BRP22]|uniref:hypothetical protein n=1 Tax=Bradyrhizobium sp. BRP22 TaxID=2793821 RepID=UPI001CD24D4E|nr:hypothetical protein [Bradyrhizobium sp. BRP22]MCA1456946.1 hypothetical protein [Bradyrhizobium sp. BRP22]
MDQRDWSRVEQELGELVPRADMPSHRPPTPAHRNLANGAVPSSEDATKAILDQITQALESDGIVPGGTRDGESD